MVFFELPFFDGMLVHESLRLFEGDALLVVGGGRIVGYRQEPADAFHDTFRVHMIPFGFGWAGGWMGILRGRPTEIAHLNGYVVQRGAALGVATPVNRALLTLVHALEAHPPT